METTDVGRTAARIDRRCTSAPYVEGDVGARKLLEWIDEKAVPRAEDDQTPAGRDWAESIAARLAADLVQSDDRCATVKVHCFPRRPNRFIRQRITSIRPCGNAPTVGWVREYCSSCGWACFGNRCESCFEICRHFADSAVILYCIECAEPMISIAIESRR